MGSILNAFNVIPKTNKWIHPALTAPGMSRKRQCGVASSNEERLMFSTATAVSQSVFFFPADSGQIPLI
jgi:hypothetical protein